MDEIKNFTYSKETEQLRLKKYTGVILFIWTLFIALSLSLYFWLDNKKIKDISESIARANFEKDYAFRLWATSHGGIYVPVTKNTPPNPNLAHIPYRDIEKPDGIKLTLMNPAYMVRQISNSSTGFFGSKSNITSLKYLYEGNKPDEWEIKALKSFESGNKEAFEYIQKNNMPYLRLMKPLSTTKGCLKCHAFQGYKVGDIRGGVGIELPLKGIYNIAKEHNYLIILGHFSLWLVVLLYILYFSFRESLRFQEKSKIEIELHNNQIYLQSLFETIPNIMIATNGNYIDKANSAMLEFTGYETIESFENDYDCICDLFEKGDNLLQKDNNGISWLDYIYLNKGKLHKVCMTHNNSKRLFIVWAKKLLFDENSRSVVTFTDITDLEDAYNELQNKEEIMIAQSRHAAMGEMISMIAHQWRQPISVIAMGANNILADIELNTVDEKTLKYSAKDIIAKTQELSKTIDDFRNFFRPGKVAESMLPEDIFSEALSVIGKSLENNDIEIVTEFNNGKEIKTYSRELMQVLINIIKNAKEVLVEKRPQDRKIFIYIKDTKNEVKIDICDNAGGIKEDIKDKIFDPYFTTKDKKSGTGLGLYMSKTIVQKHLKGNIDAYNKNGGACFEIRLPYTI